jgi:hypothetical protein
LDAGCVRVVHAFTLMATLGMMPRVFANFGGEKNAYLRD